jgi:hypothetical protein
VLIVSHLEVLFSTTAIECEEFAVAAMVEFEATNKYGFSKPSHRFGKRISRTNCTAQTTGTMYLDCSWYLYFSYPTWYAVSVRARQAGLRDSWILPQGSCCFHKIKIALHTTGKRRPPSSNTISTRSLLSPTMNYHPSSPYPYTPSSFSSPRGGWGHSISTGASAAEQQIIHGTEEDFYKCGMEDPTGKAAKVYDILNDLKG